MTTTTCLLGLLFGASFLFDGGASKYSVVVAPDAGPVLGYAAQEFTNAVYRVSGVSLAVTTNAVAGPTVRIVAGDDRSGDERLSYACDGRDLVIRGNGPRTALFATYTFLQRELAVRWYFPDPEGEIYPPRTAFELKQGLAYDYTPPIRYRGFHHCGDWYRRQAILPFGVRNFVNVHRDGVNPKRDELKYGYWNQVAFHNAWLGDVKGLFETHPEYFSEHGGKRTKTNICFASDGAADEVAKKLAAYIRGRGGLEIISIFPVDNQNYCRCEKCRAVSVSTGWFRFYAKVIRQLRPQFPDIRFVTSAYQGYRDVPDCAIEDTEYVDMATHDRCCFHPYADAARCSGTAADLKRFGAWAKTGVKMGQYNYEYDVFMRNFRYLPLFTLVDDLVDTAVKFGHRSVCTELYMSPRFGPDARCCWLQNRLSVAWYGQKMFDPSLKWEPWLREATRNLYGPAGDGVFRAMTAFERSWRATGRHVQILGNSLSHAVHALPEAALAEMTAAMADAEKALADCTESEAARYRVNFRRARALYEQWKDSHEENLGKFHPVEVPRADGGPSPEMTVAWQARNNGYHTLRAEKLFLKKADAALSSVTLQPADSDEAVRFVLEMDGRWTHAAETNGYLALDLKAAMKRPPLNDEFWRLTREAAGVRTTEKLHFSTVTNVMRPVVWWLGRTAQFAGSMPSYREGAARSGFAVTFCTNETAYVAAAATAERIYVYSPQQTFTPACGAATLAALKRGATVYFAGYVRYDLGALLGDSSLASEMYAPKQGCSLVERRATWVSDALGPMKKAVARGTTPMYPKCGKGEGWTVLAKMTAADGSERPFLSVRRVGKGVLILAGGEMDVSPLHLLQNVKTYSVSACGCPESARTSGCSSMNCTE